MALLFFDRQGEEVGSWGLLDPIKSIKIYNESDEEVSTVKYGKKYTVKVKMDAINLLNASVAVIAKCPNWNSSLVLDIKELSGDIIDFKFNPKTYYVINSGNYGGTVTFEAVLLKSVISYSYYKRTIRYDTFLPHELYPNAISQKGIVVELEKIVVVIDPGHGFYPGSTGTQCRGFEYYGKGTDGNPDKTKTLKAKASVLPTHVLADVKTWVKGIYNASVTVEEQEWSYVIDVSLKLKEKLEQFGITTILTRDVEVLHKPPQNSTAKRVQIQGSESYTNRRNVANNNNADYFISIHCDGQGSFLLSGSFVLIPRNVDSNTQNEDINKSRQFGTDIMKFYNVVKPHYTDAKPGPVVQLNDEKSVLNSSNNTQRRILIELGRMTNPNDILKLYGTGIQENIAEQIKLGIIYNLKEHFND